MLNLKNKACLVTGGASGIGRALALLLAEEGGLVTIGDVDEAGLAETVRQGAALPGRLRPVKMDVTDGNSVANFVSGSVEAHGAVHCAANVAGLGNAVLHLEEIDEALFRRSIEVNLLGTGRLMKHEIAEMRKTGGGAIVNVSSMAAIMGFPRTAEYAAAKAGLLGLARACVADHARDGIRINTVLPGAVDTPMLRKTLEDMSEAFADSVSTTSAAGRMAGPVELGFAIRWLLSEEASFINGAELVVDGGVTAARV